MKKIIKGISTLALLIALANCGKSSGSSGTTYNPYGNCSGLPVAQQQNCYTQYFNNNYGPNSNYYQGSGTCMGGYTCYAYQIPYYNSGCNTGCGTQWYITSPNGGYYVPQSGSNISIGGSFSW
ncbi:MAG: hypothetical protein WCK43_04735 [bacterium]